MFKKARKVKNGSIVKILRVVHNEEGCFAEISVFSSKKRKKAKPKKTGYVPRRYLSPVTTPHDKTIQPRLSTTRQSSEVLVLDPSFTEGKIPKLLSVMWCALLNHDGLKMEGILRRSADKTLIQEVQKRMIEGVHAMSMPDAFCTMSWQERNEENCNMRDDCINFVCMCQLSRFRRSFS